MAKYQNSRTRAFKILELASMAKLAERGIIICSYENEKVKDFFYDGLFNTLKEELDDKLMMDKIEKKNETKLQDLISFQKNYQKYNFQKNKPIQVVIFKDSNVPSYPFLNQVRSYYLEVHHPIIFWCYEPIIPWLQKFAPDFMRVYIGFFKFTYEDAIEHSKLLKKDPEYRSNIELKFENQKKEIISSFVGRNLTDVKLFLPYISKVLRLDTEIKDIMKFAKAMVIINHEENLSDLEHFLRSTFKVVGKNRTKDEDKHIEKFYREFVAELRKKAIELREINEKNYKIDKMYLKLSNSRIIAKITDDEKELKLADDEKIVELDGDDEKELKLADDEKIVELSNSRIIAKITDDEKELKLADDEKIVELDGDDEKELKLADDEKIVELDGDEKIRIKMSSGKVIEILKDKEIVKLADDEKIVELSNSRIIAKITDDERCDRVAEEYLSKAENIKEDIETIYGKSPEKSFFDKIRLLKIRK